MGVEIAGFLGPNGTAGGHNDFQPTGRVACFGDAPGYTPGPYTESSDGCPLMVVSPAGLETATWELDPSVPFSAGATEIYVLAQQWACNSGREPPAVSSRTWRIVTTRRGHARILPSGDTFQSCQGNPATPYVVRPDQAVGNRLLQDGGRWPAATLAQDGRAVATPVPSGLRAWPTASVPVSVTLAPDGMLPIGPTRSLNQPPSPCSPGIPGGVGAAGLYPADVFTYSQAQSGSGSSSELVNYDWGGHRPVAADGLHVTIPDPSRALRVGRAGMRLVVATSDGVCFAGWRVTARPVQGYDGAQDPGTWDLLGDGTAGPSGRGRRAGRGRLDRPRPPLLRRPQGRGRERGSAYQRDLHPRPGRRRRGRPCRNGAAAFSGGRLRSPIAQRRPRADGCPDRRRQRPAGGVAGLVSTEQGTAGSPPVQPTDVVSLNAGERFTIRTTDGSCGNDWSGLFFLPVPDGPDGPSAGLSSLPSNHGGPDNPVTIPLVGAISGVAPAPGDWCAAPVLVRRRKRRHLLLADLGKLTAMPERREAPVDRARLDNAAAVFVTPDVRRTAGY